MGDNMTYRLKPDQMDSTLEEDIQNPTKEFSNRLNINMKTPNTKENQTSQTTILSTNKTQKKSYFNKLKLFFLSVLSVFTSYLNKRNVQLNPNDLRRQKQLLKNAKILMALYEAQCLDDAELMAFHFHAGQLYYKIQQEQSEYEKLKNEFKSVIKQFEK